MIVEEMVSVVITEQDLIFTNTVWRHNRFRWKFHRIRNNEIQQFQQQMNSKWKFRLSVS
jgi:hypothetical protein